MTKLKLHERLAAIVPRPKIHLTRFAGVFAPHYKHRALVVPKPQELTIRPVENSPPKKSRITWAKLLKRVFDIDIPTCHLCSGPMKIIAAIEDPHVIKKILSHLGLPTKALMAWPATEPPAIKAPAQSQLNR